jgi:hypothetical protein
MSMVPHGLRMNPEVRDDGCLDLLSNNDMRDETTDTEGCRLGIAFDDDLVEGNCSIAGVRRMRCAARCPRRQRRCYTFR